MSGFVVDPNADQSFDSAKVKSPQEDADTSLTMTSPSVS